MTAAKSNLPASVAARLLNRAKQTGDVYQTLLTSFCFERFLYRLGKSAARERFVLKGAMLLRLWSDQPYRATRDLDLLRQGDGSFEAIRTDMRTICAAAVEPDALRQGAPVAADRHGARRFRVAGAADVRVSGAARLPAA
jgi:hypothetical protein